MILDITFCASKDCPKKENCEREIDKVWAFFKKSPDRERPVSQSYFYKKDENCRRFMEVKNGTAS